MAKADWEIKAEQCRKITQDSMNPEWLLADEKLPPKDQLDVTSFIENCKLLSPEELAITNSTATDLVSRMEAGTLTAESTVTAFLKRAHVGQQLLNFATEFMVEDALKRAAALDSHYESTGQLLGPLHGVPISVKEHVGLKGRVCNASYAAWTDNIPEEDALLIRLLANAGAVFHVRTNTPQSLMVSLSTIVFHPLSKFQNKHDNIWDQTSISTAATTSMEPQSIHTTANLRLVDRVVVREHHWASDAQLSELVPILADQSGLLRPSVERMVSVPLLFAIRTRASSSPVTDRRVFVASLAH